MRPMRARLLNFAHSYHYKRLAQWLTSRKPCTAFKPAMWVFVRVPAWLVSGPCTKTPAQTAKQFILTIELKIFFLVNCVQSAGFDE